MKQVFNELQLPILEINNDCIISSMGEYSIGFELTKPEIFTLSAKDLSALHHIWVVAMQQLSAGTIVHCQDWYNISSYQVNFLESRDSFLDRASEHFFNERPYTDHKSYLFLTSRIAERKSSTALISLCRANLVPEYSLSQDDIELFFNQVERFVQLLTDGGHLQVRRLDNNELAIVIGSYCQLTFPEGNDNTAKMPVELRDISCRNGISIGHNQGVLYTLADAEHMPETVCSGNEYTSYSTDESTFSIGFATGLGPLLPYNHIYNQYIIIQESEAVYKKMNLKGRRLQSLSQQSRENALSKIAVDEFIDEALTHKRQLVKAHFNIFAWAEDAAVVKDLKSKIPAAISRMGAIPHLETVGALPIWWAGIPGNAGDLPAYESFYTFAAQAACFLIPETNYRNSLSPFGLRLGDRITGQPIHTDISDEPMRTGKITNRNKFVLGGSGSGKSFFTNHLMRSYYEQGAHIVIVDIGNSYEGLCNLVEGKYFTYTEEKPLRFNPFWLPEGESLDTEKKESIKTLLLALWKKDDEAFLRSEYVALSNALQLYYERLAGNKEIFPCFNTFYEFLQGTFVQILADDRVKEKDFDIGNFLYVLRPFYKKGEYDYLLNSEEQLDLQQQRMLVFELDNIKNHPVLLTVATITIMEVFISKMRKLPGIRKVILIEEAWKALARQGMSEYIKYLFKTVRKFFGEAIVVTQEIEDIISSPIVKQTIINNADCKILLDQGKFQNRFGQIQELLALTDTDKTLVLSLNKNNDPKRKYKEVFISLGNGNSKVYRTEVSIEEYLTYTTEESEKIRVKSYTEKYGSYQKGITALAKVIRTEQKADKTHKP